jgi:hypothetical protein
LIEAVKIDEFFCYYKNYYESLLSNMTYIMVFSKIILLKKVSYYNRNFKLLKLFFLIFYYLK